MIMDETESTVIKEFMVSDVKKMKQMNEKKLRLIFGTGGKRNDYYDIEFIHDECKEWIRVLLEQSGKVKRGRA